MTSADLAGLSEKIAAALPGAVTGTKLAYGELTLCAEASDIAHVLVILRDEFAFRTLIDICGADYPAREKRFDIVYHLLSLTKNARIRIKVQTDEATAVPSVIGVFTGAQWF